MAVPNKYKELKTFYKYYNGEKKAPILTIFVGGNHEASNYMQELPYGGWVAPNIYFMGQANVLKVGNLRIGGISGIFKPNDFFHGLHESVPYNQSSLRSVYHYRQLQFFRMNQLKPKEIDIFITHDWPAGVADHGPWHSLLRHKPHFADEVHQGTLGSPPAMELLRYLKPKYWFSAHLHTKFSAVIEHEDKSITNFLALDKCLPRRRFLQIMDVENDSDDFRLQLDREWITILRNTDHLLSIQRSVNYMPGRNSDEASDFEATEAQKRAVEDDFGGNFFIPENFEMTAPPCENPNGNFYQSNYPTVYYNPQTDLFCDMVGIRDPISEIKGRKRVFKQSTETNTNDDPDKNPEELDLSFSDDD
ncbi:DgyrCDS10243 [Dimorphilus gyrociliatus]|uniref:DgyrCDS10243 n=1 Tax=Dimorphilus gyrociliatus TaxID=2664684 RepID=A0A7I8W0T9_9ANNE|nr:DgyrCDS10243 [Dimorphilus gyrociliatus]